MAPVVFCAQGDCKCDPIMHSWPKSVLPFLFLIFLLGPAEGSRTDEVELLVVSSLHSAHEGHAGFDYDDLYALVRDFAPDYVGVEIRPEDIGKSRNEISWIYPREMIELAQAYQDRVFGFDWLGHEITGEAIPRNYFKELRVKMLSAHLADDETMQARKPQQIVQLEQEQAEIVAAATASSLADGRYGELCRQIDALEQRWLMGSKYEEIIAFNRVRDEEIAGNITRFIERHKGSRIVLVMGADHRTFAVEAIRQRFGESVRLVDIPGNED